MAGKHFRPSFVCFIKTGEEGKYSVSSLTEAYLISVKYLCWSTFCEKIQEAISVKSCIIDFRLNYYPNIYLFKVNNRNTRKRCEICSV